MDEVLFQVSPRPLRFPHVEMMLHTFVACALPLVVLIIKPVLRLRVLLLAFIVD